MKYFIFLISLFTVILIFSGRSFYGQKKDTSNNIGQSLQDENGYNKNDNYTKSYWVFFHVLAPLISLWLANRSSGRQTINDYFTRTLPILKIVTWLFLACIAPFCYLPEVNLIWPPNVSPVEEAKSLPVGQNRSKVRKYKDKYAETSGSQNKRIKAECFQYSKTREIIERRRKELIARIKHLEDAFKTKCHRDATSLQTRSESIQQCVKKVQRLKRELVVLEHCVSSMTARLQFQRSQNKQTVENYEKIHEQLSYLFRSSVQPC